MASDSVKKDDKTMTTLTTRTPTADGVVESKAEVPSFDGIGGLPKVYIAIGLVGTVITVLLMFVYSLIRNATDSIQYGQELSHQQIEGLIKELSETRLQHRLDLEKAADRYIASRESAEKRHLEVLAAIHKMEMSNAKTNLFMEQLTAWFIKESRKPVGAIMSSPPPKPEM